MAFTPKQIRIGDNKEDVMRNDIFELRKDPAKKNAADKLLIGRCSIVNRDLEPKKWHTVRIVLLGEVLHLTMDDEPTRELKSPRHRPRDQTELSLHRERPRSAL